MLIGDAGGTLNVFRIKGIHQAIRSGVLGAEHLAETGRSAGLDARWRASDGHGELRARCGTPWTLHNHKTDAVALEKLDQYTSSDRSWVTCTLPPRDRVSSVFFAGNTHDENQPIHLKVADTSICVDRCAKEFGNPCQNFCLAAGNDERELVRGPHNVLMYRFAKKPGLTTANSWTEPYCPH
jgi:electron-transferring-flavoprotein dehydrogenase